MTKDAPLVLSWRAWSCPHLDFGVLASRTVRESTLGFRTLEFVVLGCDSPGQ